MKVIKKDESVNSENGKKYLRTIYHCQSDDIWINVETPLKEY